MTVKLSDSERDRAAQIIALFSVLVHSWQVCDLPEVIHTRDKLENMGVRVMLHSCLQSRLEDSKE